MSNTITPSVLKQVVRRLCGEVYPTGEYAEDERRLENLCKRIELAIWIVGDLAYIQRYKDSQEHSVRMVGSEAVSAVEEIRAIIGAE